MNQKQDDVCGWVVIALPNISRRGISCRYLKHLLDFLERLTFAYQVNKSPNVPSLSSYQT